MKVIKNIFAALIFLSAFQAQANVLCEIITKDPRYNVASYVRSQTACVNTNPAGTSAIGPQLLRLGALSLLVAGLEYLNEKRKQKEFLEKVAVEDAQIAARKKAAEYHLITVNWEDGNKDTFNVRGPLFVEAIDKVKERFANSATKAVYIHAEIGLTKVDMSQVIDFDD